MPIVAPFSSFQRGAAVLDVIQDFGAVADGVTDDWPAWNTALQFSAKYGQPVWASTLRADGSPAVYALSKELLITIGSRVLGDAVSYASGPILRAIAPMRSIIACRTTDTGLTAMNLIRPAFIEGIVLDANGLADQALLLEGCFFGHFRHVYAIGGKRYACRLSRSGYAASIGAISSSRPGGSPAASSVVQADTNYFGLGATATAIQLKCASNGARGSASYVASFDGGATFATAAQTIAPVSNICVTSGATFLYDSGFQVTFPAGSYVSGDILASFTVTLPGDPPGSGNVTAINADATFEHCEFRSSGAIQGSSGAIGSYTGLSPSVTTAAGTVSTTLFSSVIVGNGTAFVTGTATPSRSGDYIWVAGVGNVPIACVLDDNHIALPQGVLVDTFAGAQWAMSSGAGFWEDDNGENVRVRLSDCRISSVPNCSRHTGSTGGGDIGIRCRQELFGFVGCTVGGLQFTLPNFTWIGLHVETGGASANAQAVWTSTQCQGGTFLEPCENFPTGALVGEVHDYGVGAFLAIRGGVAKYFGVTPGLGGVSATSANAGAASALPATPQEYITVLNAAGQARKVPLYLP